jgi:5-bromo-4-chloroindolyl phosphate hydrolysis protein|tara:strand:+ start:236 stop:364 length:129 start_codon:yes stop_codon:yes gene_type:complete
MNMWEEIQDSPGEIYDMEDFYKQLEELREIMDKCVKLEEEQS